MLTQITWKFGGREYVVKRKFYSAHLKARQRIKQSSVMRILESLDGFVAEIKAIINSVPEGGKLGDIDLGAVLGLVPIAPAMAHGLLNSVEEMVELLFEYEPKLKTERKWIEEHAYDEEFVYAFVELLKMLFPIMAAWETVSGRAGQETSTNSPSQNGASPLPPTGPKKKSTTLPETTPT